MLKSQGIEKLDSLNGEKLSYNYDTKATIRKAQVVLRQDGGAMERKQLSRRRFLLPSFIGRPHSPFPCDLLGYDQGFSQKHIKGEVLPPPSSVSGRDARCLSHRFRRFPRTASLLQYNVQHAAFHPARHSLFPHRQVCPQARCH